MQTANTLAQDALRTIQRSNGGLPPFSPGERQPESSPPTDSNAAAIWMDRWHGDDMQLTRAFAEQHTMSYTMGNSCPYMVWDKQRFDHDNPVESEIPEIFKNRSFESFSTEVYSIPNIETARVALRTAQNYVQNFGVIVQEYGGSGLYFVSGTKGSGKTHLACAVGNALIKGGIRARYQNMVSLLDELKASFDRERGTSAAAVKESIINAQVLILDDIGVEQQKPWIDELLYAVLDARNIHGRPTIFTSNLLIDALKYDDRVKARIEKMALIVALPEESIRRKLARVNHDRMRAMLEEKL